jgi:hypothetical protein
VEAQVRTDVAALGTLTGITRSFAEIAYALARTLDSGESSSPASVARELATRLQSLSVMSGGGESRVDQLASRRAAHVAAKRASVT